jgi:hypothetical protein
VADDDQDQRPMKPCPDCAELVLEAARKCRYCGYRFDRQESAKSSKSPFDGLFAHFFRRSTPRLTMAETLQQLGIELEEGERPAGIWLGRAKGIDGYVVLTDRRFCFVIGLRDQLAAPTPPWQHRLNELAGATVVARRLMSSALVLDWRDAPPLTVDGLSPKDLERLHAAVLDRVPH